MPDVSQWTPADQEVRERALDIHRSFIVQAPAGSGKTELLTRRFLKLLASVEAPEQVLAITFTRAATAEMRKRVIESLEEAERNQTGRGSEALPLAREALRHSQQCGWQLLQQPQRLNIQTIDSLCLSIAHRTPLLARLGGTLQPTENAEPLYSLAAKRTLQQLGVRSQELNEAIAALLRNRDNNLNDCQSLIAQMLRQRDQWQQAFPLSSSIDDWDSIRERLEAPFRREVRRVLAAAHSLLSQHPTVVHELLDMANYACRGTELTIEIGLLAGLKELPPTFEEYSEHWNCLTNLLMKEDGDWRRSVNKNHGFPPSKSKTSPEKARKDGMKRLIENYLQNIPGLRETLNEIRALPPARYDDDQWEFLRHLFTTLRHSVAELKVVFAEQNVVDFVELGIAAEAVLLDPSESLEDAPSDLALAIGDRVRHLLIDEFQDTSRRQHQLLTLLVRGWNPGDGRTCFLVGDPMQSIYLFRQAEVELFTQLQQRGLDCDGALLELDTLQLTTNFRSDRGVVEPLNSIFPRVFGQPTEASEVRFTPSVAKDDTPEANAVIVHPDLISSDRALVREAKIATRNRETEEVVAIVERHLPMATIAARHNQEYTIAVLVRAKNHLALIAEELRNRNIPYRSVELETLHERQEILDLTALTRALVHPMDRIAWLAVLRAPWCGLTLADLHALAGYDEKETRSATILQLLDTRMDRLSADGQSRARRVHSVLQAALRVRFRQTASPSFSSWIERTWHSLGGPLCVDSAAYENVQAYFQMLDLVSPDGIAAVGDELDQQMNRLFALPDPETSERTGVQLMTIHKAKGLGFNVVIVPGLDRTSGRDRPSLICWLERVAPTDDGGGVSELLVSPIGQKGESANRLRGWVQRQKDRRETDERKRVLYVACTRARNEVHLFGTALVAKDSSIKPESSLSLLATAWPAVSATFDACIGQTASPSQPSNSPLQFPGSTTVPAVVTFCQDEQIKDLAASGEEAISKPLPPLMLRRLPSNLSKEGLLKNVAVGGTVLSLESEEPDLFQRPEGSREARALGTAVHALFEAAARMMQTATAEAVVAAAASWRERAVAILRNDGVEPNKIEESANRAVKAVQAALQDPVGRWILGPHAQAQVETSWTGWLDNSLRTLRVDRVFLAGTEPMTEGDDCLWIIDYKTASRESGDLEAFLLDEKEKYQQQLQSYGRILRLARGDAMQRRLALYYPFMSKLKYWTG